jgi:deoxyribodipyrimidine photo-lyase
MVKIFWFRKDLRLFDNRALAHFIDDVKPGEKFLFLYVKNPNSFKYFGEMRISFLNESLKDLSNSLEEKSLNLNILKGNSLSVFKELQSKYKDINVYANRQVEPYSIKRDKEVTDFLESKSCSLNLYSDTTLFEPDEIKKDDGNPYSVFTPFSRKCNSLINESHYKASNCKIDKLIPEDNVSSKDYKFEDLNKSPLLQGGRTEGLRLLKDFYRNGLDKYKSQRDFPSVSGTSFLSAHLHFGTVSIRECYRAALKKQKEIKNDEEVKVWMNELLWREFYYHITHHFPYVIDSSFKQQYDKLEWNYDEKSFKQWCEGKTGYPIVDAGMRQLNEEGWMHNRVRMITAMFLTKDLFIDWRLGEKYFAEKLIDLDFASNNGGWQWSASTGCDAQPYFRIFNPYLQSQRFDAKGTYIRKYVKELKNVPDKYIHKPDDMNQEQQASCGVVIGKDYPYPIVEHKSVKENVLNKFKSITK